MKLYLGNRSYSSWSLRAWLLMKTLEIPFEEVFVDFDDLLPASPFKQRMRALSPAARVPVLQDAGLTCWDSLAIVEYLAERYPQLPVWPADPARRAEARSVCAHLHSSYMTVRGLLPMNIGVDLSEIGRALADHTLLRQELDELTSLWSGLVARSEGPFLFGAFGAADAFFAPYLLRFASYGIQMPQDLQPYRSTLLGLSGLAAWIRDAERTYVFVAAEEPYRTARDARPTLDAAMARDACG